MPGAAHLILNQVKCRLTVLKGEEQSLREMMVQCQNALAQNETDQAHALQRIAELETEIKYWKRNEPKPDGA